jgi:hypothetical protein
MDPEIYVVAPTYYMYSAINSLNPLSGTWGSEVHLTGDSERWLGAQFAKVIRRVLVGKQPWQPLRPLAAWTSEDRTTVFVRYHVPVPPIVIDNSFLPAAQGAGLFIPAGPNVVAASVYSADTIALTLDSPLSTTEAFSLEYASEHGTSLALSLPQGAVSAAPSANQAGTYDVVVAGDIRPQLTAILQHGVFYLQNNPNATGYTYEPIRNVYLDGNGNTVLEGNVSELYNGVPFQAGQPLFIVLIWPYGNIRDSDAESTLYKFSTGPRAGQPYPLWNWSVGFEGLTIGATQP